MGGPGIEQITEDAGSMTSTTDRLTDSTVPTSIQNASLIRNDTNNQLLDDLISKLPLHLPQARYAHRLPLDRHTFAAEVDTSVAGGTDTPDVNQSNENINEQSSHLNVTEIFSNSVLVQELLNETSHKNTNEQQNQELRNEFHLSNLSKATTKEMILEYMKLKGIQDTSHVYQ